MRPCRTRHDTGRRASQDCMKIFGDLGDLLGYTRSHNICNFLSCKTDQDRNNRSVTLPPELYKASRDAPRFHLIICNIIHKDTKRRVLHQANGLNLSNHCLLRSMSPFGSLMRTSTDSSTTMGISLNRQPDIFHRQTPKPKKEGAPLGAG